MNKKGGAIVEAAMIFPVTVMVVVSLIIIMVYFYDQLNERVEMHMALRVESGNITETLFYHAEYRGDGNIYRKAQQIYSSRGTDMKHRLILSSRNKSIDARKYLIDEAHYVRMNGVLQDHVSDKE